MTAYSQTSLGDTIEYPLFGFDKKGLEIVTITKDHQNKISLALLQLKQCEYREDNKVIYIRALEDQIKDYEALTDKQDQYHQQVSIMLQNREQKILGYEDQLKLKDDLQKQAIINHQITMKKLKGWKIGSLTVGGIIIVAIPITILSILLK